MGLLEFFVPSRKHPFFVPSPEARTTAERSGGQKSRKAGSEGELEAGILGGEVAHKLNDAKDHPHHEHCSKLQHAAQNAGEGIICHPASRIMMVVLLHWRSLPPWFCLARSPPQADCATSA